MKILLADDHALFREGISYALNRLNEQVVILDVVSFPDALDVARNNPDLSLALIDLNMPGSEGAASVEFFHTRYPDIPVVVISGSDQRNDIEQVMNSGAMGFISKQSTSRAMLSALRLVLDGGIYLPPQLLQQTISNMQQEDRHSARTNEHGLTARQTEVLQQLTKGLSNKGIALAMNLAEGTVKVHIAALFQTLGVNNRMDALKAAKRRGLIVGQ